MDLNPIEALEAAQVSAMAQHPQSEQTAGAIIGAARLAELVKFVLSDYSEEDAGEIGPKDTDGDTTQLSVNELEAIVRATQNFREEIAFLDNEIAGEILEMLEEVIDEVHELTDGEDYDYADPKVHETMGALKQQLIAARAALVTARIDGLSRLADSIKPSASTPGTAGLQPAESGVKMRR